MALKDNLSLDILPTESLIVLVMKGKVTFELYKEATKIVWNHPDYRSATKFILDISLMEPDFSTKEIAEMKQFSRSSPNYFKGKAAIIAVSPLQTAFGLIYNKGLKEGTFADIFSTWEGACEFLDVDFNVISHLHP